MICSIADYGAVGDGQTMNTKAIQETIDAVLAHGGGTVRIPPGDWLTGTLQLGSLLTLEIQQGAILRGSPSMDDYPVMKISGVQANDHNHYHLLIADTCTDLTITGGGTIAGNGPAFWDPPSTCDFFTPQERRPSPWIEIRNCTNLRICGLTVSDSPGWTIHLRECRKVQVRDLTIRNNLCGPNTDGLDITDCQDVLITGCDIRAGDDAIVLKSLGGINERIVVSDCVVQTRCSAFKLGAQESHGTIRQVTFNNCIAHNSSRGISLYCVGGGIFEDISFSNMLLDCDNDMALVAPIHIDCCRHPNPKHDRGLGIIRRIRICGVICQSDSRILLTCSESGFLEDISLDDILMSYPRQVENEFAWAAKAIDFQFSPGSPEARAAMACVVASNIHGLTLRNIRTHWPSDTKVPMHFLWARNIENGFIDCPQGQASLSNVERIVKTNSQLTIR